MVRFSQVIIAYFIIGAVIWAGGGVHWANAGVGSVLVDASGDRAQVNESTQGDLEQTGGPIEEAASVVEGLGLLAIWNLIIKFIAYLFWPITVLKGAGAPIEVTVLLGGSFVMSFIVSFLRVIRGSV